MKYELKFVHPLPLLVTSARLFVILGTLLSFFMVFVNPQFSQASFGPKLLAFFAAIAAYTVFSTVTALVVALLYNFFARRFHGLTVHLDPVE